MLKTQICLENPSLLTLAHYELRKTEIVRFLDPGVLSIEILLISSANANSPPSRLKINAKEEKVMHNTSMTDRNSSLRTNILLSELYNVIEIGRVTYEVPTRPECWDASLLAPLHNL